MTDDTDDEEQSSTRYDQNARTMHMAKASEHKAAALRSRDPLVRQEHLYAASLHKSVAVSPQGFTGAGHLKPSGQH